MSGLDITLGIFIALGAFTILYSFVRLWWRLRQGDVEPDRLGLRHLPAP